MFASLESQKTPQTCCKKILCFDELFGFGSACDVTKREIIITLYAVKDYLTFYKIHGILIKHSWHSNEKYPTVYV